MGPLVITGILITRDQLTALKTLGVKDSKALSPRKREDLSKQIKELIIKQACVELSPLNIDRVVLKGKKLHKLNFLEAQAMAEVINELKPDVAYVDASDVKAER
ncbi:ribonuclease HII, partial [Candidatus Bathyarchaeota archaeon]|nr:ribonuclease HII [Candidatus Bathyarchaeota archaeon]